MNQECTHLDQIRNVTPSGRGCKECLEIGDTWVHLRLCMTCGHVGCCDSSKNKHATRHFHSVGHPIVRSFEPGEDWIWCYVDQVALFPMDGEGEEDSEDDEEGEGGDDEEPDEARRVRLSVTKEFLRKLPIFGELPDDNLSRLCEIAEPAVIAPGQLLIEEGSPADALYIIVDGEFEVSKRAGKGEVVIGTRGSGEMIGEMALIEQTPRNASVRAARESSILSISRNAFYSLLAGNPPAVMGILRTFIGRLRSTEALLVQHDKLASLGTLAAGLAHELNNPAAAIHRSAGQLKDALSRWQRASLALETLDLDPGQIDALAALRDEVEERAAAPPHMLDPLDRSDMESEMQDWLDEQGVEDAWEVAPVLAGLGWDAAHLQTGLDPFTPEQVAVVVPWLSASASAYGLLGEVSTSAQRISELVKSVKTYSYLDQSPVQQVDVHSGIESTLIMLSHNLKTGVTVHKEYEPNLPEIEAYGSELNQVWTNLLDNAISAMGGHGEITIKTYTQGTNVVVEIADSGPGIPPEVQTRVFEPFFTTKPPGAGTGLGLHIVYNIVVDKHHGSVRVESRPGYTCFQVVLPQRIGRE